MATLYSTNDRCNLDLYLLLSFQTWLGLEGTALINSNRISNDCSIDLDARSNVILDRNN
jgi:hypothetical protein